MYRPRSSGHIGIQVKHQPSRSGGHRHRDELQETVSPGIGQLAFHIIHYGIHNACHRHGDKIHDKLLTCRSRIVIAPRRRGDDRLDIHLRKLYFRNERLCRHRKADRHESHGRDNPFHNGQLL